jgi:hypothetical protein
MASIFSYLYTCTFIVLGVVESRPSPTYQPLEASKLIDANLWPSISLFVLCTGDELFAGALLQ